MRYRRGSNIVNKHQKPTSADTIGRLKRENQELRFLFDSATAIGSSLDQGQVITAIMRQLMMAVNAERCRLLRYNQDEDSLYPLAEFQQIIEAEQQGTSMSLDKVPPHHRALMAGRPLISHRTLDNPTIELFPGSPQPASRVLIVPLQIEGDLVGTAEIVSASEAPTESLGDMNRVMKLALDIAHFIDTASSDSSDQLIDYMRRMALSAGGDTCSVFKLDETGTIITRLGSYGRMIWSNVTEGTTVGEESARSVVLKEHRIAVLTPDSEELSDNEHQSLLSDLSKSMLLVPLVVQHRTVGLAELHHTHTSHTYDDHKLKLIQALVAQAAISLENARLFESLNQSLNDLKQTQAQLIRAARFSALGEMAAMIAHQVNNPLTTMLADAEMLTQDLEPGSLQHQSAEAILKASRRASTIIQRVLSMSRGSESPRPVDIHETIDNAVELSKSHGERYGVALSISAPDEDLRTIAIPGQLEDVWLNLIMNAVDAFRAANQQDGLITIRITHPAPGGTIQVRFQDNGPGISEVELSSLFDPLFTTKPPGEGTGLGLYICQQIITNHQGTIHIGSNRGEGTTALVTLPIHHAPPPIDEDEDAEDDKNTSG